MLLNQKNEQNWVICGDVDDLEYVIQSAVNPYLYKNTYICIKLNHLAVYLRLIQY